MSEGRVEFKGGSFYKKDVLNFFNVEGAKIGVTGYFGHDLAELCQVLEKGAKQTLRKVAGLEPSEIYDDQPLFSPDQEGRDNYQLFLPESAVISDTQTVRPFATVKEFTTATVCGLGAKITFRDKDYTGRVYSAVVVSFQELKGQLEQIGLGTRMFNVQVLCKKYEYRMKNVWHPFGVELEK